MCTYHRQLKNGNIQEFVFELDRNKYQYIDPAFIIEFHFTIYDNCAAFTIDTGSCENQGYGAALISIMFEILETRYDDVQIAYGKLSTSDYYDHGNNWKRSIPFYLHRKENSYLIKTNRKLDLVYGTKDANNIFKTKYRSYEEFTNENISDGYIIYPLKA